MTWAMILIGRKDEWHHVWSEAVGASTDGITTASIGSAATVCRVTGILWADFCFPIDLGKPGTNGRGVKVAASVHPMFFQSRRCAPAIPADAMNLSSRVSCRRIRNLEPQSS